MSSFMTPHAAAAPQISKVAMRKANAGPGSIDLETVLVNEKSSMHSRVFLHTQ